MPERQDCIQRKIQPRHAQLRIDIAILTKFIDDIGPRETVPLKRPFDLVIDRMDAVFVEEIRAILQTGPYFTQIKLPAQHPFPRRLERLFHVAGKAGSDGKNRVIRANFKRRADGRGCQWIQPVTAAFRRRIAAKGVLAGPHHRGPGIHPLDIARARLWRRHG